MQQKSWSDVFFIVVDFIPRGPFLTSKCASHVVLRFICIFVLTKLQAEQGQDKIENTKFMFPTCLPSLNPYWGVLSFFYIIFSFVWGFKNG